MRTLFSFNPCNPENVVDVVYSVQEENIIEPGNTVEENVVKAKESKEHCLCVSYFGNIRTTMAMFTNQIAFVYRVGS